MSDSSDDGDSVRELIWRCLDGVASEAEAARLSQLVVQDPQVARELARAGRLERNLEAASRVTAGDIAASGSGPGSTLARPAPRYLARWAVGTGIALVVATLMLVWSWRDPRSSVDRPTLRPVASGASPGAAGGSSRPAAAVTVGVRHPLRFRDGSMAMLRDQDSRLETRLSTAQAIDVALTQGGARFEVVPLPARRFRVWVTASTYVEVIGTVFSVDRVSAGVRVSVERGTVKVVSPRSETRISAGGAEVIALDGPRAHEAVTERPPEHVRAHAAAPRPAAAPNPATEDEAGSLLRAATDARRAGRPQEAVALLQRFIDAHAHDPRSAYEAFILGRVLLEEMARPAEAAVAFARVAALDPRTPLVEDALAREVQSLSRAGDLARAQQRAALYLQRYPTGARADEVRRYGRMK